MALGWNLLIPLQGDRNTQGQYRPYTWLQLGRVIHTRLIPKIKATYFIATITPLRTTKYRFKESLKMCTFNIWRVNIWLLMPSFTLYWHLMRNMKKNSNKKNTAISDAHTVHATFKQLPFLNHLGTWITFIFVQPHYHEPTHFTWIRVSFQL